MSAFGYEILEHTADTGIRGRAPDLPGLFRVMAEGMFAIIASPGSVRARVERKVRLEAESLEDLLHDWLEELNALHQIHGELYRSFEVDIRDLSLRARVFGEPLDPVRHQLHVEVKAVTWHGFRVESKPNAVEASVLFDI